MAARKGSSESIPPTLSPEQATNLLQRQIDRLDTQIIALAYDDPAVEAWLSTTKDVLHQAFGQPNGDAHAKTKDFMNVTSGLPNQRVSFGRLPNPKYIQHGYELRQRKRLALLRAFIEQLNDHTQPSSPTASDRYVLHSKIDAVSGRLYRDGHYKQAALEAYIRVIEEVRMVSHVADDGDSLMNKAFGCDKHVPAIQFNGLNTEAERDEQRGIMYLFKGIVGLRNSKAHSNRLFDDSARGQEYLALASLLMRLLEIAQVNHQP